MASPMPPNIHLADFHIGWICIVEKEYLAALDVLDERWSLDNKDLLTTGDYELGRVGGHNVVICLLRWSWYL